MDLKNNRRLMLEPGFTEETYSFLLNLAFNNNKTWFEAHKEEYVRFLQKKLVALEEMLAPEILKIDPNVRTGRYAIARIYRDTRFSANKSPFRDHLWIAYRPCGVRMSEYFTMYFEVTPITYGYGCGWYGASVADMNTFRSKVLANPSRFEKLICDNNLMKTFTLGGEDYKRPKVTDASRLLLPWLNKKGLYLHHETNELKGSMSKALADEVIDAFHTLAPIYRYIHEFD